MLIAEDYVPTYQYVCTDCQSDLEAVQSFHEPSLSICPSCGGKLRKRFGAVGVVFKGSGFYRTDSRSDTRSGAGPSTGDKPAGETKAESKNETKSETKTESSASSSSNKTSGSGSSSSSSSTAKATSAA
jgi:putative FmdB family regulatory protein